MSQTTWMWRAWLVLGMFTLVIPFLGNAQTSAVSTEATDEPVIYMFGRDDCKFCKNEKEFLDANQLSWVFLNVTQDAEAKELFDQITTKHDLSKVTPVTVIGSVVLQGYDSDMTTGVKITDALETEVGTPYPTLEEHIANAPVYDVVSGKGCDENGLECGGEDATAFIFDLPFVGIVDLKSFSLFTLSVMLGVIDGFNPCAMWVLITFLTLLSQAGSRKKMIFMAGLFIVAEAIMYNLILNVWYKTWDFIALDQYVTPAVGLLAIGGGLFFLWRWNKNKDAALVCDITDLETQSKTIGKFQAIIHQPVTIASVLAILVIAFSVNIIEFACSIGIPQAYTKILDLNALSFIEQQWYILLYTLGYMVDDIVVFGLAIWGYSRLQAHGGKYAQLSLLIGGVLMLILGIILVANPSLLVL